MSERLYLSMLSKLKLIVEFARIIFNSYDKVTTVDNTSWIEIHVYAIEGWERVQHLLHLSHAFDGGIASYLTTIIIDALINEGSLTAYDIIKKVMCFWG